MRARLMQRLHQAPLPLLLLLAAVLTGLVYSPVRHFGFVWDDVSLFVDTDFYRSADAWQNALSKPFSLTGNYFRPLALLGFVAESRWHDMDPGWMHVTGLLLHLLNATLVGLLAWQISQRHTRSAAWLAAAASLGYGLHYGLLEVPAWVSCRFDLLCTFFLLLLLLADISLRRRGPACLWMALCYFLAACSKEMAVVMPLVLPCWHLATARLEGCRDTPWQIWSARWPRYAALLASGGLYMLLRAHVLAGATIPIDHTGQQWLEQPWLPWWTLDTYLRLALIPFAHVTPIYPQALPGWQWVPLLILAMLASVSILLRRHPAGQAGTLLLLAALASLLPVLNIVSINLLGTIAAARYLDFPMSLLVLGLVAWSLQAGRYARILVPAWLAWMLLSILNITLSLPLWQDPLRLWTWAAGKYPDSAYATVNRMAALLQYHPGADTAAELQAALQKFPDEPGLVLQMAENLLLQGRHAEAETILQRLQDRPMDTSLGLYYLSYLATAKLQGCSPAGQIIEPLQQAIRIDGSRSALWLQLAMAYHRAQETALSTEAYEKALQLSPPAQKAALAAAFANGRQYIDQQCMTAPAGTTP